MRLSQYSNDSKHEQGVNGQFTDLGFYARQHICYSVYMLSPGRLSVCPSVSLSVCHTGGSVKNG